MIIPRLLQKGDSVALLAPSGPCQPSQLAPSVTALEHFGLRVKVMQSCTASYDYLAAEDEERARDLNTAFADTGIRGIFAIRGGYGAQRILPMLDYGMICRNPKVFAAYSDATALHTMINQACGFVTFHAPMAATELTKADNFTRNAFTRMIFRHGEPSPRALCNPDDFPLRTVVLGHGDGILTGGNLSLLASSIGTPFEINTVDRILFIEEVNEPPYCVDRMLLQLLYAGKFQDCRGVLLGSFHPEDLNSLELAIKDLLLPEAKRNGIPILAGLACGHIMPTLTLPLGARVFMDASRKTVSVFI